jgi:hypothetical protein
VKESHVITAHAEFRILEKAVKYEKKTYCNGDGREY